MQTPPSTHGTASSANSPSEAQQSLASGDEVFTNTPNILTLTRILFVPFVVAALWMRDPRWDIAAALIFGVAAATDYLDGYIARTQSLITVYGKLMDPLADKFLVVCSLVMLQHIERVSPYIVMLLICREMAITGLRALASAEGVVIAASGGGKWKTAVQMVAIPFLMVQPGIFGIPLFKIGEVLLYISVAVSLWSAKDYVVAFFSGLRDTRRKLFQNRRLAREARRASREARLTAKLARMQKQPDR